MGTIRKIFMYRHFISKVAVVQEEKDPLPRCDLCGMQMSEEWIIRYRKTAR